MYVWMKKIHTHAGLFCFTAFVVWGITGIHAVFLPPPGAGGPPPVSERKEIPFAAPGHLDDRALAQRIVEIVDIPMANTPTNVRRTATHDLSFVVYTVNGRTDVTYLEREDRIEVGVRKNDLWGFLASAHTGRPRSGSQALPARLWGVYNEVATWAFLFMCVSGAYLWLATRPRLPWARMLAAGAAAVFIGLWILAR